jgi:hypothetical protein
MLVGEAGANPRGMFLNGLKICMKRVRAQNKKKILLKIFLEFT